MLVCLLSLAKDFGNNVEFTTKTACFLVDIRDSEGLALKSEKLYELKAMVSSAGIKVASNIRKGQCVDLLVEHRCQNLIFQRNRMNTLTNIDMPISIEQGP